jgi:hypothetical protein
MIIKGLRLILLLEPLITGSSFFLKTFKRVEEIPVISNEQWWWQEDGWDRGG